MLIEFFVVIVVNIPYIHAFYCVYACVYTHNSSQIKLKLKSDTSNSSRTVLTKENRQAELQSN